MKLITADQMREIDRITIQERGIPAFQLMDKAGRAVAMDVAEHLETGSVAILCGKGNNGGDGFVAARYLANGGWDVLVLFEQEPAPEAGAAREAWEAMPGQVRRKSFADVNELQGLLSNFDVAIDALLGTGVKGRPRVPFDGYIEALNAAGVPVFAVDTPSGLHPEEGTAELAVQAFRTITMGLPKVGMVTAQGPRFCGGIRVESLDFPDDLLDGADTPYHTLTPGEAKGLLPSRPADGHKGTFGMLLVASGNAQMPGAAVLCGHGAIRGGCGLLRYHVPSAIHPIVSMQLPEAIFSLVPPGTEVLRPLSKEDWAGVLDRVTALAVGPAITTKESAGDFLRQVITQVERPTVLDADALTLISQNDDLAKALRPDHVLTPHPGEMGTLLGISAKDVQADRWGSARRAVEKFGCVVVLKGFGTLVAEPGGNVTHIPSGNSAWGRGGAGDVLTGLIGSLLAQGLDTAGAAKLGAFLHGMAADIYVRESSPRGALIRDIAACLPQAFRELETV